MLHVRPATTSDLKLILNMIDEAAGWLRAKATDQWEKPWPSQEERDERVRRGLETGRTWVVEDNGIPVATITCCLLYTSDAADAVHCLTAGQRRTAEE